jgi:NADPH2:quinone reductase
MRAVLCRAWGGVDDLTIEDVPPPSMVERGVRVRVRAAGLNFADTLMLAGKYQVKPELPFIPGLEVGGEVIEVGAGVTRCRPGDKVIAHVGLGAFAEEVVTPEARVYVRPKGMDDIAAAGFPIVYGTSHMGLTDRARLQKGEVLVVHGAAGGVGLTAVEIGKRLGATVIATAGGQDKLAIAEAHGADHAIDYKTEDIRERVKALTGGRGADVVFDPVGGAAFEASLRSTAPDGRIIIVGFASGTVPQIPANVLLVKNITVIGYYWGGYRTLRPEAYDKTFAELFRWYEEGALKPHVSHTFPLAEVKMAYKTLLDRRSTGKVVVTMG